MPPLSKNGVAGLLRVVNNIPNPHAKTRRSTPPQFARPATPSDIDASPVTSDEDDAVALRPQNSSVAETADDEFQDIDEEEPNQIESSQPEHITSRGRSKRAKYQENTRSRGTAPEKSLANGKTRDYSGKRKRDSSPFDTQGWNLADVGSNRIFSGSSSQQRKMYSRRNLSSQDITQLHGTAVKVGRSKLPSKSSSNGIQFRAPPSMESDSKNDKTAFKQPAELQSSASDSTSSGPTFKAPPILGGKFVDLLSDSDGDSSPLSSIRSSISSPSIVEKLQDVEKPSNHGSRTSSPPTSTNTSVATTTTVPCPMCKAPVERSFLESFSNGQRLRSRQALRFCEEHQRLSAQQQWITLKYPSIDWDRLETRLQRFHDDVFDVLEKRKSSAYLQQLEERIAASKGRASAVLKDPLLAGDAKHSLPGYYGSRGGRLIAEHAMRVFGRKLRQMATVDPIFKIMGLSGYVQAVLVPEMACYLVMEDMDVGEEKARELLIESATVGELVNAEEEERITVDDTGEHEEAGVDYFAEEDLLDRSKIAVELDSSPEHRKTRETKALKMRRNEVDFLDF